MYSIIAVAFWFCLTAFSAKPYTAYPVDPLSEPWRWRHITPLDEAGFRCMEEGADGSMWFGVNQGVLHYDGMRWRAYAKQDGLTDSFISSICRAADGSIYAANPEGVWCFRDNVWSKVPVSARIRCLSRSRSGVWIGTDVGALHLSNGALTLYSTRAGMNAAKSTIHTEYEKYLIPNQTVRAKKFSVWSVCEDKKGRVWFLVNRQQLVRLDPAAPPTDRSNYLVHTHKEDRVVIRWPAQFRRSDKGQMWFSSPSGIYRLSEASNQWIRQEQPEIKRLIGTKHALALGKGNTLLFAILNNLYVKRDETWTAYPIPSREQSTPVLLETSDGNLWLGKEQGKVFRIDCSTDRWLTYKDLHFQCDLPGKRSWYITSDNRAVFSERGKQRISYGAEDGLPDMLLALYCSRSEQVWAIGSHGQKAATAYFKDGRWVRNLHPELGECLDARVGTELQDGRMVFAALKPRKNQDLGGLLYAAPDGDGGYTFEHESLNRRYLGVTGVAEVGPDELYCGMYYLFRKQDDQFIKTATPAGAEPYTMDCLTTDRKQQLWLAARDFGVCRLAGTNWVSYTPKDGLGSSRISALACDSKGTVWASMAHGFSRFDGRQWQADVLDPALPGVAVETGSLKLNRYNHLWINYCPGTWYFREGAKVPSIEDADFDFKTVRYRPSRKKPETELVVSSQEVSSEGNAYFEWSGVAEWESTPQHELTYSWRLDDGEWSRYSKKTSTLFLGLHPGHYRFEVRARDRDFNVDSSPAVCAFTVLAPVWRQPWFVSMVSLFSLGLLLLTYLLVRARGDAHRHQIEMEQVKLRFFTSISHEFRTPLTVMLAPLQSLMESLQDEKAKEKLRMVIHSGQKLHRLVDQVLDFRKLDSGRMPIEWTHGDLVEATDILIAELQPMADEAQVTLRKILPTATCMVWFDPDKWQKIISNLLSNAIKFTPENGIVSVVLEVEGDGNSPIGVILQVEDNGIGVPEAAQEHIFEPYYRAKSSAKGTGIGLSFVKQLVELLNGSISLESPISTNEGKPCGSRFRIELPVSAQPPEQVQEYLETELSVTPEADIPSGDATVPSEKPVLLVVDDSADIRNMIQSELADEYSVLMAENGAAGFEVAKEKMPDLILSDLMMPVMNGLELCRELKADEITSHIPVIMLTARTSEESELEGLHSGADDYITKPFTIPILKARIYRQLEARRMMRERFSHQGGGLDMSHIQINSVDEAFLERAVKVIKERICDEDFSSEAFAEAMGMKERTFRNKIKAITDLTPMALIRRQRLEFAKQLLEQPGQNMTVSEIGAQVCFYDVGYFAKVFKKQYGCNPSDLLSRSNN